MIIPFCELRIKLGIDGILGITDISLTEGLNEHGILKIECILDEDYREKAVANAEADSEVSVMDGDRTIFFGCLYSAEAYLKKGKWELNLE